MGITSSYQHPLVPEDLLSNLVPDIVDEENEPVNNMREDINMPIEKSDLILDYDIESSQTGNDDVRWIVIIAGKLLFKFGQKINYHGLLIVYNQQSCDTCTLYIGLLIGHSIVAFIEKNITYWYWWNYSYDCNYSFCEVVLHSLLIHLTF